MLKRFMKLAFTVTERQAQEDRLEIKFVFPGRMLTDARLRVLLHPMGFARAYPARQVNNVYFDDPDLETLQMNQGGISQRVKVRVRWYGDIERMRQPVLELKIKSGSAGRKLQYPLESEYDLSDIRWSSLTRAVLQAMPSSMVRYAGYTAYPALLNSYQREYYATLDGTIRATIDHGIRSFDQRLNAEANWQRPNLQSDIVVVEFKADMTNEADLRRATSAFGWRISRNSKYVRGLASTHMY
ncbi:polyphosphate polymerase domain-containing protein [Dehalococcoidia bacterium]|nr:polyphosphate polymerase domain-containing protein [Dehalococcoidia bacterium]